MNYSSKIAILIERLQKLKFVRKNRINFIRKIAILFHLLQTCPERCEFICKSDELMQFAGKGIANIANYRRVYKESL